MRTKKKENSKVPKSAKTRLSDLTPKKDTRGGRIPEGGPSRQAAPVATPAPTPPFVTPPAAVTAKKWHVTTL